MKKTILTLAVVTMFFITGFSFVSGGTLNQIDRSNIEPAIVSSDYEPPLEWEKPKAYFSLHNWSEEDLEITVDGEPVDDFSYFTGNPTAKFENVDITFNQKEYMSLAWTYTLHPFITYKWRILFPVMLKILPIFLANRHNFDEMMEEVFNEAFYSVLENSSNICYYFKKGYTYNIHIGTLSGVNPYSLQKRESGFFQYDMSNMIEFDAKNTVEITRITN